MSNKRTLSNLLLQEIESYKSRTRSCLLTEFITYLHCNVSGYLLSLALISDDCISFWLLRFYFKCSGWKLWRIAKFLHLPLQLIWTCLNWHSRAVKAKRKEHTLPLQSLVPRCKLQTALIKPSLTISHVTWFKMTGTIPASSFRVW